MRFERVAFGRLARELGFVRDTFEKVCRLADILKCMEDDALLSNFLALKGGTAINLTILDLPRLSVDIDLDFSENLPRDEMFSTRQKITERLEKYMRAFGYSLSLKSKNYHALDSFVYEYQNLGGMKDNLKIEINYMMRCHVLPPLRRQVNIQWLDDSLTVLCVAPIEIFASKIVALLNRTAPRDLYDIHNMLTRDLFGANEQAMLRKCVMLYSAIASDSVPESFVFDSIARLKQYKIKTDLMPVLRRGEQFNLNYVQNEVIEYLSKLLTPEKEELSFWEDFNRKEYRPELLFGDSEEFKRIVDHPMAIWKCSVRDANKQRG